jgi:hypothetical protein
MKKNYVTYKRSYIYTWVGSVILLYRKLRNFANFENIFSPNGACHLLSEKIRGGHLQNDVTASPTP